MSARERIQAYRDARDAERAYYGLPAGTLGADNVAEVTVFGPGDIVTEILVLSADDLREVLDERG